ncbi:MAG TPA: response regulator transcription factor [Terriglobales bacterium]
MRRASTGQSSRPRILIADDHALVADALKSLLEDEFDVVAIVHDGRDLIETAQKLRPDVLLVDIGIPVVNGLEAAQRIKRLLPQVKVICVTINRDPGVVAEAFQRGASGYLPKTAAASELKQAIHDVLRGEVYVSPLLQSDDCAAGQFAMRSGNPVLTERQSEVLQLLAEGKSMKETAAMLNVAPRTVAFHKYRIMQHLGLKNNSEVVQYALRHHVVFR